jgi:uncharacterized Fe-S radical SAM superfamily protein PflX
MGAGRRRSGRCRSSRRVFNGATAPLGSGRMKGPFQRHRRAAGAEEGPRIGPLPLKRWDDIKDSECMRAKKETRRRHCRASLSLCVTKCRVNRLPSAMGCSPNRATYEGGVIHWRYAAPLPGSAASVMAPRADP